MSKCVACLDAHVRTRQESAVKVAEVWSGVSQSTLHGTVHVQVSLKDVHDADVIVGGESLCIDHFSEDHRHIAYSSIDVAYGFQTKTRIVWSP
jgi:hypothetical protein